MNEFGAAHSNRSWLITFRLLRPPSAALVSLVAFVPVLPLLFSCDYLLLFNLIFSMFDCFSLNLFCLYFQETKRVFSCPTLLPTKVLLCFLSYVFHVFLFHLYCYIKLLVLILLLLISELQHLRNSLPDEVVVQRIEERLSALGNCIACNDYVALTHTDLDRVSLSLSLFSLLSLTFIPFIFQH